MKTLDRYITARLAMPFLIGVLTFAVIMLGDAARGLGQIVFGMRVPPDVIGRYLLYHAPHAIVWSMPVGTVVAVAMTVVNLKTHGEIDAMRAGGAGILRICVPLLLAGLVASGAALAIGEYVVPAASRRAGEALAEMTRSQPVMYERDSVYFRDEEGRTFYIGHMDAKSNQLQTVMIWTEDDHHNITEITAANWAELEDNVWVLHEGTTMKLKDAGQRIAPPLERFGTRSIKLRKALQNYYTGSRRDLEMSGGELKDLIDTMETGGSNTQKLQVKWHFKYSIPLACFVFALIAAPISLRYADYGTFAGVVIAILVVFLYNGVRSWTLAFGLAGSLHPAVAGWTQNVLFGLIGLYLLARTR